MDKYFLLLQKDPPKLVEELQFLIISVVNKFVKSKAFTFENKEDIIQAINEQLLTDKIYKIQKHYNSTTKLTTYFTSTVINLCYDIIKMNSKRIDIDYFDENINNYTENCPNQHIILVLKEEVKKLEKILLLFGKKRIKLLLFLKVNYEIKISIEDLVNFDSSFSEISDYSIEQINSKIPKKNKYEIIAEVLKSFSDEISSADSLRKWTDEKIKEIILLLNGKPPIASYDSETLGILVEKYFETKNYELYENV